MAGFTQPAAHEIRFERVLYALSEQVRLDMIRQLARAGGELYRPYQQPAEIQHVAASILAGAEIG